MSTNNKEENIKENKKIEEESSLDEAKPSGNKNKEKVIEKTVEEKLKVHTLFQLTKPGSINHINMYIQVKDPELWNEIKRKFYPSLLDKIKSWFN